jgi:hypothetical protein
MSGECTNKRDNVLIENLQIESIEIAGAPINIFPLMGVHNQGSTVDLVGVGYPLSSGTPSGFNALDGFNSNDNLWQSHIKGLDVLRTPAWIGYSFGTMKNAYGAERYESPQPVRNSIRTIKIKQSQYKSRRATQIRIDQSDDGVVWKRVDVINVKDDEFLNTYGLRMSPKAGFWRLVPTMFNGALINEPWEVVEIQLLEETQTSLDDIQDPLLLENRDRQYNKTSVQMKCYYDIMDISSDLSRFGIELPTQYIFTVPFLLMVSKLGRPIVVGDLIEMPTEKQYDNNLVAVKRWLEVTDASWATDGYTPNWKPLQYKFYASPVIPSVEHRDILGTTNDFYVQSDDDFLSLSETVSATYNVLTDINAVDASISVPEAGTLVEESMFEQSTIAPTRALTKPTDIYIEDGIPPNGAPYTEGNVYPSDPTDGDYHRLTYVGLDRKIPTRLYQWNEVKRRWVFIEQDNRQTYSSMKPSLSTFIKQGKSIE